MKNLKTEVKRQAKDKKQLWQAVKFTLFSVSVGVIQICSFVLLETWYEDGKLHWSIDHFSDFVIVYEGTETPDVPDGLQTGDNSHLWLWWLLLIVSAVGITVICIEQKSAEQLNKQ